MAVVTRSRTRVLGLARNPQNEQHCNSNAISQILESRDDPFAPGYGYDPFKNPAQTGRSVQWESIVENLDTSAEEAREANQGFDNSPYVHDAPKGTRARAAAYDSLRRGRSPCSFYFCKSDLLVLKATCEEACRCTTWKPWLWSGKANADNQQRGCRNKGRDSVSQTVTKIDAQDLDCSRIPK